MKKLWPRFLKVKEILVFSRNVPPQVKMDPPHARGVQRVLVKEWLYSGLICITEDGKLIKVDPFVTCALDHDFNEPEMVKDKYFEMELDCYNGNLGGEYIYLPRIFQEAK